MVEQGTNSLSYDANVSANYRLPWNVRWSATLGFTHNNSEVEAMTPGILNSHNTKLATTSSFSDRYYVRTALDWEKKVLFLRLGLNVGVELSSTKKTSNGLTLSGLASDKVWGPVAYAPTLSSGSTSRSATDNTLSFTFAPRFSLAGANLGDRYIFNPSIRPEANSAYGKKAKWVVNPGLGFKWNYYLEPFMKQASGSWLDYGAIRVSPATGLRMRVGGVSTDNPDAYFRAGDPIWADLNGDYVIDENDKKIVGNSQPRVTGGLALNFRYGAFSVFTSFSFTLKRDIINAVQASNFSSYSNPGRTDLSASAALVPIDAYNFWTAENTSADYPNPFDYKRSGLIKPYRADQTLFQEDGSYLSSLPALLRRRSRCAPITSNNSLTSSNYKYITHLTENDLGGLRTTYKSDKDYRADGIMRWADFYEVVQQANILINEISRASVSDVVARRARAEAVFMRCLAYFMMVRNFGDVPYYTNAYNSESLPRTDMITVLHNLDTELTQLLADDPTGTVLPMANSGSKKGVRASRGAVLALDMHVNMWLAGFDTHRAEYPGTIYDYLRTFPRLDVFPRPR